MKGDYTSIITLLAGAIFCIALALLIILSMVRYKSRNLANKHAKAHLQHTFDSHLLQSQLETQEQSLQYFSEEIHDNVGQVLTVIGMNLYQLEAICGDERARELVQQSSELLGKVIVDLRSISHTLNAQYISRASLIEVLNQEIAFVNSVNGALCRLEIEGEPEELSGDRQTILYRILQEALGNAIKFAKADSINIGLSYKAGMLTATVMDNGHGFNATAVSLESGTGIANMQLRSQLLGGTLQLQSNPHTGTVVSLTIPVHLPA